MYTYIYIYIHVYIYIYRYIYIYIYIYCLLARLGAAFGSLLEGAWGPPWAPFGFLAATSESVVAHNLWVLFAHPWNSVIIFRARVAQVQCLRIRFKPREFSSGYVGNGILHMVLLEMVHAGLFRTYLQPRLGARIYIYIYVYIYIR